MISIRQFKESDNRWLSEIEVLCPQGNEKCTMGVKKTDTIARYRMYDRWNAVVAEEDGKIAGWTGWAFKRDPSEEKRYAYLAEVMVHPQFRRKGVATRLAEEAEKDARDAGCDYIYCYIYAPNNERNYASMALFESLGYSNVADTKTCSLSVYKKANLPVDISVERIQRSDIDDAASLINDYYGGCRHFVPYTGESLAEIMEKTPSIGLEDFWVAKDKAAGRVVACGGLWDCSPLAKFCYSREPASWKIMGLAFRLLGRLMRVQEIPEEGEYLHFQYLVNYAFDRQHPEAMHGLLGHLNNVLLEKGSKALVVAMDQQDAIFGLIKKYRPQADANLVFAKPFNGALPEFRPLYVDIRDMIL